MAREKSGSFDNRQYQNEYHRNMKKVLISFNRTNEDDMRIWEYLEKKKNVTGYIKDLIRADMAKI